MSCYTRHLEPIIDRLNLENTKENRKMLDERIRTALNAESWHCPEIWKEVKEIMANEVRLNEFIKKLK